MTRIVLASRNPGKLEELRRLLAASLPGVELLGDDGPEPAETGTSFEENALIKARAASARTGLPAIADDSGICVDVLGGAPGIFSARWSGPAKDDRENVRLLLWQLADISDPHRAAHFTAAAALVVPGGPGAAPGELAGSGGPRRERVVLGRWAGRILTEPRGDGGFGYDPVFGPDDVPGRSAAELSPAEKDALSHRRRAFEALVPVMREQLAGLP